MSDNKDNKIVASEELFNQVCEAWQSLTNKIQSGALGADRVVNMFQSTLGLVFHNTRGEGKRAYSEKQFRGMCIQLFNLKTRYDAMVAPDEKGNSVYANVQWFNEVTGFFTAYAKLIAAGQKYVDNDAKMRTVAPPLPPSSDKYCRIC